MNQDYNEIIRQIAADLEVATDRNYWFLRTYYGALYQIFEKNNYIGYGHNSIPQELVQYSLKEELKKELLSTEEVKGKGSATRIANELLNFKYQMKKGDYVVIPDENSSNYLIGEIVSDLYTVQEKETFLHRDKFVDYPIRRRKVEWKEQKYGRELRKEIAGAGFSFPKQAALSSITHFGEIIQSFVSPIFRIKDANFLVIHIDQEKDIDAFALNQMLTSLIYFYHGSHQMASTDDLFMKIQLRSKGTAILKNIGNSKHLVILYMLIQAAGGGKVKVSNGSQTFEIEQKSVFLIMNEYRKNKIQNDHDEKVNEISYDQKLIELNQSERRDKEDAQRSAIQLAEFEIQMKHLQDSIQKLNIRITNTDAGNNSSHNLENKNGEGSKNE